MLSNRQLHLQYLAPTNPYPLLLQIEKAEGVYLYSPEGKKYFDLISGIAVSSLGHSNPAIIEAIKKQLDKHLHVMVYGEFVQEPQLKFAQRLCENLPDKLNSVFFVNSGSEATEGALKLARKATQRTEVIYFKNAYHGSTTGALSVIGDESFKSNFRPLVPGTRQLKFNSISDLEHISKDTAAVIMETVQGESGVNAPDEIFMKELRTRCTENGAILILDEIQCGLGRTGALFAFTQFGIEPDILLLAKALGGGLPLGAFICNNTLMENLASNPMLGHITTFGGHPLCCAAGLASFEELINKAIYKEVPAKADIFKTRLVSKHIQAIRSFGLMLAIEFVDFESNKKVIDQCLQNGVVTDWFLFNNKSLRIAPPLIISDEEIEECCEIINTSITQALG